MVVVKRDSKTFDINVRHSASLSGKDRHDIRVIMIAFQQLNFILTIFIANNNINGVRRTRLYISALHTEYLRVATVPQTVAILYGNGNPRLSINSASIQEGVVKIHYRFLTKSQLRRLMIGFQIPQTFRLPETRNILNGELVLLFILERLATNARLFDLQEKYNVNHSIIGKFINH